MTDYSKCDVELWGKFGGGATLLRSQRLGTSIPDRVATIVRYSGGWFASYEVRIYNRATAGGPNVPTTCWTLHSWKGNVSTNEPCGHTRWSSRQVACAVATPTLLVGGDPSRRRALISYFQALAGDYIVVAESAAAAVVGSGFPLAASIAAGARFVPIAPLEFFHTGEIWVAALTAGATVSIQVAIATERE